MKNFQNKNKFYAIAAACLLIFASCDRDVDEDLPLATYPNTAEVFTDLPVGLGSDFYFPYSGSKATAFSVDNTEGYDSSASIRIDVPNADDTEGNYAGGIFRVDGYGRDLSGYDALTLYAKASQATTLSEIGFGEDFGDNAFMTTLYNVDLTTNWQKIIIPIPDASKLTNERGVLRYAAKGIGEAGQELGYTFWLDEIKFEKLGTLGQARPAIMNGENKNVQGFTGTTYQITGLTQTVNSANGKDITVGAAPAYFDFKSSDESIATVDKTGLVTILNEGNATITALLNGVEAAGSLIINSIGDFKLAPKPTLPANEVISIFSDAYDNVPVDFYNGYWQPYQTTESADFDVNGNHILNYTNFNFVGIQFSNPTVDASQMDFVHFDLYFPKGMNNPTMKVTLKDFGSDASDGGSDDTLQSYDITTFKTGKWIGVDIPLNMVKNHMGQIILEGSNIESFYLDNIYFYKKEIQNPIASTPAVAAPTPTESADNVISLFSNNYTDVVVDTWRTDWSAANLEEVSIAGNDTKKYSALSFVGIETIAQTVDASAMNYLHIDVWSPDFTKFSVKLVDFGTDGAYDGGDDSEHQVDFTDLAQGEWVSLDIPLSDFSGLNTLDHIAQYIFVAEPNGAATVYVDNVYFYQQ